MPNSSEHRIGPNLAVLLTGVAVVLLITIPAWRLGRTFEDQRHFLKPFRAPYDSEAFFTITMDYEKNSSEANDVVFCGGSTCLCGIQVEQFETDTHLRAYNLGTIGMLGGEGYYLIFKSYLEHHPPPRVAVFCILPREAGPYRQYRVQKKNSLARSGSVAERFFWCYGAAGDYPRPTHANALQYYVSQGMLMILGKLRGGTEYYWNVPSPNLGDLSYNQLKTKVEADRGFYLISKDRELPPDARSQQLDELLLPADGALSDDPYPIRPDMDEGVRKLAQLAADHHVLLVIRLSPELVGDDPEHCGRIRAWFHQLEKDYPHLICDRPEIMLYEPEFFSDLSGHCNLRGAKKFTDYLAARVQELLKDGRDASQANPAAAALPKDNRGN